MAPKRETRTADPPSDSDEYVHSDEEGEGDKPINRRQPKEYSSESSEASEHFLTEPNDSELSVSEWEGSEPEGEAHLRKRKEEKRLEIRKAHRAEKKSAREAMKMEKMTADEEEEKKKMEEEKEAWVDLEEGGGVSLKKRKNRARSSRNKNKAAASSTATAS
jgi:hypothetical protein